jgi:ribosomal protein S18 acetylase RimI-like enzyme
VSTRRATEADEAVIRELWQEFQLEVPIADDVGPEPGWNAEWAEVCSNIASGAVYLAEDDQGAVGMARATGPERRRSHLVLVYVRPWVRRQGVAKGLVRACVEEVRAKGAVRISLDVLWTNTRAREVWTRLGFEEVALVMATPTETLERRLTEASSGPTRAVTHVQSDDRLSVERALARFVPRLESPAVGAEANGWMRITDPLTDVDREAQGRLARELSERLGAVVVALAIEAGSVVRFRLYERGRMVDEYLSVPTFYGPLPKGDELALAANPTLVARLTGADRDEVRRVARTASSPAELPPADELYEQIARTMGLEP